MVTKITSNLRQNARRAGIYPIDSFRVELKVELSVGQSYVKIKLEGCAAGETRCAGDSNERLDLAYG